MIPIFHRNFQKFVKKTNIKLFQIINLNVNSILANPNQGTLLEHPFRKYKIRKTSFIHQKNSYRIAYTLNSNTQEIIFLLIDSRENFYKKLSQMDFIRDS